MGKKIYLIGLLVITIVCVGIGVVKYQGGIHLNFGDSEFTIGTPDHSGTYNESSITVDGSDIDEENAEVSNGSTKLDAFHSIQIDGRVMDLTVKRGTKYEITYEATKLMIPSITVDDDVLEISQTTRKNLTGNNNCRVVITIPEDEEMIRFDAKINVGDCKFEDFSFQTTSVSTNVGDIKIKNSNLGECELETNTGDIKVEDCKFGNMEAESNVGDIQIDADQSCGSYAFDCHTDVGEVSLNHEHYGKKLKIKNDGPKMEITGNVGDIDINDEE